MFLFQNVKEVSKYGAEFERYVQSIQFSGSEEFINFTDAQRGDCCTISMPLQEKQLKARMIAIPIPREGDGGFPWDSRQTDELAKQYFVKMRKDDEAEVKAFVKFNQEYSKLRNRREDVFRLLKGNYRLPRFQQEVNNYFIEGEGLQKLLDKVEEIFKETEFSKDVKRRTDENR